MRSRRAGFKPALRRWRLVVIDHSRAVDWWSTLHQPASVVRLGGSAIDPSMLTPLMLMAAGFVAYFLALLILRVRAEIAGRKVQVLMMGATYGVGEIHGD